MKNGNLSDQVRNLAKTTFVKPAYSNGEREFAIPVRELMDNLERNGFPRNHTPQICSALQTGKFLRENGLEIISVDGPKSKTSTTVVFHYRIVGSRIEPDQKQPSAKNESEEPVSRAKRLTGKLRGLLRSEIAEHGGAEAFMRWVRSEDEDAA
jgi:hypothetical protein